MGKKKGALRPTKNLRFPTRKIKPCPWPFIDPVSVKKELPRDEHAEDRGKEKHEPPERSEEKRNGFSFRTVQER